MTESHDCKDYEEVDSTLGTRVDKLLGKQAHRGYYKGRGGITGLCRVLVYNKTRISHSDQILLTVCRIWRASPSSF